MPYLPVGVHVAVVDPGVGTARRGVALATPGGLLVGPDNGLLLDAATALGGVTDAVELTEPRWLAARVSTTFHGRDVFAPAAALAAVRGRTFGDAPAGGLVAYVDSAGLVAVAVNGGRAADLLAASPGDLLRVSG